jgi:hypothetical protein
VGKNSRKMGKKGLMWVSVGSILFVVGIRETAKTAETGKNKNHY